jgi:hypothetical protein
VEGVWQGTLKEAERHSDVEFFDGTMCHAEIHWYEAHGIGRKSTRSSASLNDMKTSDMKREAQYVICVGNKGYPASLELRKIYQIIPDKAATRLHQIRVTDESGEDYLYPEDFFVPVQLPQAVERAVRRATA